MDATSSLWNISENFYREQPALVICEAIIANIRSVRKRKFSNLNDLSEITDRP